MKVFLSSLENSKAKIGGVNVDALDYMIEHDIRLRWNLISYYYIRNNTKLAEKIRDNSEELLVDSGAHSFQKGVKVSWDEYTEKYAEFIRQFDRPNVVGYFEMDVDNIIGYERVLGLRRKLEAASAKIIPVWHKNRGVKDFCDMCHRYEGKIVAITGFKNEDISDEQYVQFLKYAKKYGCKVHCLGMTRRAVLDRVPFDYTDSSTWKQYALHGWLMRERGTQKVSKSYSKENRGLLYVNNYIETSKMQDHYYKKWRSICND